MGMGSVVLSVDDVPTNQLIMGAFLKRLGSEVHLAENGRKAADAVEKRPFGLLLMDFEMPEMGCVEATTIIKHRQHSIPIVLVTASTDDATLADCRASGAYEIMHKPFDIDTLALILKRFASMSPPSSTTSTTTTTTRRRRRGGSSIPVHEDLSMWSLNNILNIGPRI